MKKGQNYVKYAPQRSMLAVNKASKGMSKHAEPDNINRIFNADTRAGSFFFLFFFCSLNSAAVIGPEIKYRCC